MPIIGLSTPSQQILVLNYTVASQPHLTQSNPLDAQLQLQSCPFQDASTTHYISSTRSTLESPDLSFTAVQNFEGESSSQSVPILQLLHGLSGPGSSSLLGFSKVNQPTHTQSHFLSSTTPTPLTLAQQFALINYLTTNPSLAHALLNLAPQLSDLSLSAHRQLPMLPLSQGQSSTLFGSSSGSFEAYDLAIQPIPLSVSLPTEPSISTF
ncbi:hypothetical protein NE237_032070 [Protea cynaroides]|uniref:Uncharacterized protein n=1 Tax=Protea cynaroides TaxID=273540 RepID=A0A9Q0L2F0_9MAGN|nr:hypothetical protein NE237_032070 [Protea cynaroides]